MAEGKEREGIESDTWQMNSYTYRDKLASLHVVNLRDEYKHRVIYTYMMHTK